jgi:hypothetical protein
MDPPPASASNLAASAEGPVVFILLLRGEASSSLASFTAYPLLGWQGVFGDAAKTRWGGFVDDISRPSYLFAQNMSTVRLRQRGRRNAEGYGPAASIAIASEDGLHAVAPPIFVFCCFSELFLNVLRFADLFPLSHMAVQTALFEKDSLSNTYLDVC